MNTTIRSGKLIPVGFRSNFSDCPLFGREAVFGCLGYIIGIGGMPKEEAHALLGELHAWQTQPEFVYRHRWQADTLVMWDNRAVLRRAIGGYEGYDRLLHRTTIGSARRAVTPSIRTAM